MKRFKVRQAYLAFMMLILSVLIAGCGSNGQTGHWLPGFPESSNPDITKPRVTAVVPLSGATVPINTKVITAVFSEAMLASTITATGTFTLECPAATPVTGTVTTYLAASNLAILTLSSDLPSATTCTATITTAATDLDGNQLAGNQAPLPAASNYVWTFTTGTTPDSTAPTVTLLNPADDDIDICVNATISAAFDEPMDPATLTASGTFTVMDTTAANADVPGIVTYDIGANIATFTPLSNLTSGHVYAATITTAATDIAGNPLAAATVWNFTAGATTCQTSGAVALGSAGTFGLMATAAITAATGSTINGDVSLEPGTSMTGFPPAVVNGNIHINDSISHQARADLLVAYNQAKGLACTTNVGATDLGSLYVYPTGIPPGVYCSGSTMLVGAQIVLDAGGDANAVWVFQIGSSLTSNADVTLTGGAQAKNVFWVPTFDVIIGSGTTFNGTIVAGRDATSAGSATINGRILAGATTAGTISLNGPPSTVNVP